VFECWVERIRIIGFADEAKLHMDILQLGYSWYFYPPQLRLGISRTKGSALIRWLRRRSHAKPQHTNNTYIQCVLRKWLCC
jgi:hypothetical protein